MKKSVMMLLVWFIMLCACNNEMSSDGKTPTETNNITKQEIMQLTSGNSGMLYWRDLIYYYDPDCDISAPICGRSNCQHKGNECDACVDGCIFALILVDDSIYYVTFGDEGRNWDEVTVWKMDRFGQNRKELAVLDNTQIIYKSVYNDGKWVISFENSREPNGEKKENPISGFWIIDLVNEEVARYEVPLKNQLTVGDMFLYDKQLYFSENYMTEEMSGEELTNASWEILRSYYRTEIDKIDLIASVESMVDSPKEGYCGIYGSYGLVLTEQEIYLVDLISEEKIILPDCVTMDSPVSYTGKYFVWVNDTDVFVYDPAEQKVISNRKEIKSYAICAISEDYLIVMKDNEYYYMRMSDYLNGSDNWRICKHFLEY